MIEATHFHRKPAPGQVSIERLFAEVRKAMPPAINCSVHVSRYFSKGVFPRVANVVDAARHQSQVNHITGDVHYLAICMSRKRTLLTIHDCVSLERLRGIKRAVFKWIWYTLPIRCARLVSVVSESTRRELLRHVQCDSSKIRVVHNCVGSDFVPAPKSFNSEDPLILQVGTGAIKNLNRVATELSGIRCRLNIIGALSEEQRRVLDEHHVRYTNVQRASDAEIVRAYQECDMVVFASTYEGFGLPIVEGNAVGRPVVTSNILSMPEVAGQAACLVDPLDTKAIRSGMLRVRDDDSYRAGLISAGFENVKRFAPTTIAAQYAALYRELAAKCCSTD